MEIKIILVNAMIFKDKETGNDRVRISYVPVDKGAYQNGQKFRGYAEIGGYTNNTNILEQLNDNDFLNQATLIGEEVSNSRNPFKKSIRLKTLITKNANIDLL